MTDKDETSKDETIKQQRGRMQSLTARIKRTEALLEQVTGSLISAQNTLFEQANQAGRSAASLATIKRSVDKALADRLPE